MKNLTAGLIMLAFAGVGPAQTPKSAVDRYGDALPDGAIARLGTVRFRGGFAQKVAFAPNGKILASMHNCGGGCLWDTTSGQLLHRLPADFFAHALAFSADGKMLVAGLRLIDVATGKEVHKFEGPYKNDCAAFSPDGMIVAINDREGMGKIIFWDVKTGKKLLHTDERNANSSPTCLAFSPKDGKLLAAADYDKTVRIWDVATGKRVFRFEAHKAPVYHVSFALDGKSLMSVDEDGRVLVWDVETGKTIRQMATQKNRDFDHEFSGGIAVAPDRKSLAIAGIGGIIGIWSLETGKEIRRWETHYPWRHCVAFSPNGKKLATTDDIAIRIWDTETAKEINPTVCHHGRIRSVKFASDGKTLLSFGADRQFMEWDLGSPQQNGRSLNAFFPRVSDEYWAPVDLSPDRKIIAQMSVTYIPKWKFDRVIRLFDTATGKERGALRGHKDRLYGFKFSPDGKLLASGGEDGIRLWNVASGKELYHWPGIVPLSEIVFSPDGGSLATAGYDDIVHLLNVATGKEIRSWKIDHNTYGILTFSPDGRLIATGEERQIHVWDAQTGKQIAEIAQIEGQLVYSLAFSPTGRILASGWSINKNYDDFNNEAAIKMWEVQTGQETRQIDSPHPLIGSLAFAPDGKTLASGGDDSTILLWDLARHAKPPLAAKEFDALWTDLRADAGKADRALWSFALAPEKSVAFLKERLKPMPAVDAKRFAKLLGDLNSKNFADRQKAQRDLVEFGESVETALRKCLADGPTLELQRRVEQILQKREPDVLRQLRAIDTLEQIGMPAAREVMEALAKSTPTPRVAQAVQRAMGRLTP